jgi:hypothetical protein
MKMRTTVTIDEDVAVQLKRLQRERNLSFKEVINDTLRGGLRAGEAAKPRKPFKLKTFDCGKPLIPLDNVAEVIAYLEGDDHK